MQRETSNDSFLDYGSVYHQPIDREHPELIHQTMVAITRRYVSQFYCFNCDTYLQVKSGIGVLLVSHTAEAAGCAGVCDETGSSTSGQISTLPSSPRPRSSSTTFTPRAATCCISQTFLPSTNFWPSCPASRYRKFWATTTASALRTTVSRASCMISLS